MINQNNGRDHEHVSVRVSRSSDHSHKRYGQRSQIRSEWGVMDLILSPRLQLQRAASGQWDNIFRISCLLAVLLDPWFCYIPVITEDRMCYSWDQKLTWTFFVLRTTMDVFYAIDLWKTWSKSPYSRTYFIRILVNNTKRSLIRIFLALPILQAIILTGKYSSFDNSVLFLIASLQYSLRVYSIHRSLKQYFAGHRRETMVDLLPFILCAHLYGAFWYALSLNRQLDCWVGGVCHNVKGCDYKVDYFYCDIHTENKNEKHNMTTLVRKSCSVASPATTEFDFGIYLHALQTGMTNSSTTFPRKLFQCLWWGLRQLSSFGSNLESSLHVDEIIFSLMVSITGLTLFLVYFSARMEESKQRSDRQKVISSMQMMLPDIQVWLLRHGINPHDDRMFLDKEIMSAIILQKIQGNKDVDTENFFSVLPSVFKKYILRSPRLHSLRSVPALENIEENVLQELGNHLNHVFYAEDNYIIDEGQPLEKMVFIIGGTAWIYKSSNTEINGSSKSSSKSVTCLEKGGFYGDEILDWAFKFGSFSEYPISKKTVKSQTKVEAFVLRANDLKTVVGKFWWHFGKPAPVDVENLAALSLQRAFRHSLYRARARATGQRSIVDVYRLVSLKKP